MLESIKKPEWLKKPKLDSVLSKTYKGKPIPQNVSYKPLTIIGDQSDQNYSRNNLQEKKQPAQSVNNADFCKKCRASITWFKFFFY